MVFRVFRFHEKAPLGKAGGARDRFRREVPDESGAHGHHLRSRKPRSKREDSRYRDSSENHPARRQCPGLHHPTGWDFTSVQLNVCLPHRWRWVDDVAPCGARVRLVAGSGHQCGSESQPLAVAHQFDGDGVSRIAITNGCDQTGLPIHGLAVHGQHDVTGHDASLLRR